MTAFSRSLAWLMLPVVALCSFSALADTSDSAGKALHLLDYIGADYPSTVEAGKVIDESEYREQLEFLGVLQGLVSELPAKPEQAELNDGIRRLRTAVTAHEDGAQVARQARQLGARLAVAYEVSQAPIITPDPALWRAALCPTLFGVPRHQWQRRWPGGCRPDAATGQSA